MTRRKKQRRMNCYPPEFRLRVLREVLEEKTPVADVERIFSVGRKTIYNWLNAFKVGGESSLTPAKPGPSRPAPSVDASGYSTIVRQRRDTVRRERGLISSNW